MTKAREGSKPRDLTNHDRWWGLLLKYGQCEAEQAPMVSLRLNLVVFYTASERGQSPKLHKVARGCGIRLEAEKAGGVLDLGGLDQPGQHGQNPLGLKLF